MKKRKDLRGRNLRDGEDQMPDGRFRFRYAQNGKRKAVYSWKLVSTDKVPQGKRDCLSLRELEKNIEKDLSDGIDAHTAAKLTVNDVIRIYLGTKKNLKESTRQVYDDIIRRYITDTIGQQKLSSVRFSTMSKYFNDLSTVQGLKPHTIRNVYSILHPAFDMAVRDSYIRLNPTDGLFGEIKKDSVWQAEKRHALTPDEQRAFLNFLEESDTYRHYKPLFVFLLGTGTRIGEAIVLRWDDVDFSKNTISVNHAAQYLRGKDGVHIFKIDTPKTEAGHRTIPMFKEVREALRQERENQMRLGPRSKAEIDGYSNFIFVNGAGNVYAKENLNTLLRHIVSAYNEKERADAEKEHRESVLIRPFSLHNLRHTFCTRLIENDVNVKTVQEIMGHTNIQTTLNIYAEVTEAKKEETFANLEGKMLIS